MVLQKNEYWVREIQTLFAKKLFVKVDSPEKDLFESGILDSLNLVELLLSLEQSYGFTVSLADLNLEDFRSVSSIAAVLSSRQPKAAATGGGAL